MLSAKKRCQQHGNRRTRHTGLLNLRGTMAEHAMFKDVRQTVLHGDDFQRVNAGDAACAAAMVWADVGTCCTSAVSSRR